MGTGHPAGRRKRRKDSNRKLSDAVRTRSVAGRSESYDDSGSVEKSFEILDSDCLGINYDPSHFVWQMIDPIRPIYEFKDKIFHVHYKDIKLYPERLNDCGIMAYPLDFMSPKIPGLGDVDWGRYVSALTDIGYNGYSCIEIEDKAFESSRK